MMNHFPASSNILRCTNPNPTLYSIQQLKVPQKAKPKQFSSQLIICQCFVTAPSGQLTFGVAVRCSTTAFWLHFAYISQQNSSDVVENNMIGFRKRIRISGFKLDANSDFQGVSRLVAGPKCQDVMTKGYNLQNVL